MADQQAQNDENRVHALLIHDSTGAETRQVRATSANPNAVPVEVLATAPGTGATSLGKAEDTAHTSGDVGVEMLAVRRDTAASSTATDGDYATVNTDSTGHVWHREGFAPAYEDNTVGIGIAAVNHKPVASSTYSGTSFIAVLNDVDISVKATAGNLLSISATNINAAARYLQVFNKATAPAGGDTAVLSFVIPAGTALAPAIVSVGRDFLGQHGQNFSTGIAVGVSTAAATFTAATTTDHIVNGTYV